jgi:hypothetical protein
VGQVVCRQVLGPNGSMFYDLFLGRWSVVAVFDYKIGLFRNIFLQIGGNSLRKIGLLSGFSYNHRPLRAQFIILCAVSVLRDIKARDGELR